MMRKQIVFILSLLLIVCSFCSCGKESTDVVTGTVGKEQKFEMFEMDVNAFCDELVKIDEKINSIDAQSSEAPALLLEQLDILQTRFDTFSKYQFPEEYAYLSDVAVEAKDYVDEAVESYHNAYEAESFDSALADYADANYERAFKRIYVIMQILRGEEPNVE